MSENASQTNQANAYWTITHPLIQAGVVTPEDLGEDGLAQYQDWLAGGGPGPAGLVGGGGGETEDMSTDGGYVSTDGEYVSTDGEDMSTDGESEDGLVPTTDDDWLDGGGPGPAGLVGGGGGETEDMSTDGESEDGLVPTTAGADLAPAVEGAGADLAPAVEDLATLF